MSTTGDPPSPDELSPTLRYAHLVPFTKGLADKQVIPQGIVCSLPLTHEWNINHKCTSTLAATRGNVREPGVRLGVVWWHWVGWGGGIAWFSSALSFTPKYKIYLPFILSYMVFEFGNQIMAPNKKKTGLVSDLRALSKQILTAVQCPVSVANDPTRETEMVLYTCHLRDILDQKHCSNTRN